MKKDVAKKWVSALRSKKYKKGLRALKVKTKTGVVRHCCLGVLCELYQKEHGKKLRVATREAELYEKLPRRCSVYSFAKNAHSLPATVMRWAGIENSDGALKGPRYITLSNVNDNGYSFEKIANIIADRFTDL